MKSKLAYIMCLVAALSVPGAASEPKSKSPSSKDKSGSGANENRKVYFSNISLRHLADHFAAISGKRIFVESEIAGLKISGRIKISDVDSFLHLLPQIFPVRVDLASYGSVQILPREKRNKYDRF